MNKNEKAIIADVKTAAKQARELAAFYGSIAAKLQLIDGTRWPKEGEYLGEEQVHRNLADTFIRRSVANAKNASFQIKKSAALVAGIAAILKEREAFAKQIGAVL